MGQNQQIQTNEEELELTSIQDLYKSFIMECPSGSLYLHEFKRMFGVQNGTPESQYMDSIFRAFDMNRVSNKAALKLYVSVFKSKVQVLTCQLICVLFKYLSLAKHAVLTGVAIIMFPCFQDNTMDFIEYVAAINLVLRGKLEDKLRWSFKVFDSDSNGYLDRDELQKIVMVKSSVCFWVQPHVLKRPALCCQL